MNRLSIKRFEGLSWPSESITVLGLLSWAGLALVFYLLFGVRAAGQSYPDWYTFGTTLFECVAFLAAALLCWRNGQTPGIMSGQSAWRWLGAGMFLYFLGDVLFGIWELVFRLDPDVSPGDFCFFGTYLCLGVGIGQVLLGRRLNLPIVQWIGLGVSVVLACAGTLMIAQLGVDSSNLEQQTEAAVSVAPDWAIALDQALQPLGEWSSGLYLFGDMVLLAMSMALLLAFWGGRFAWPWRLVAAASVSLYLADIWYVYATRAIPDYESGGFLEVFWVLSGVLFALGAATEHTTSTKRSLSRKSA
jgi:hypothetical protein